MSGCPCQWRCRRGAAGAFAAAGSTPAIAVGLRRRLRRLDVSDRCRSGGHDACDRGRLGAGNRALAILSNHELAAESQCLQCHDGARARGPARPGALVAHISDGGGLFGAGDRSWARRSARLLALRQLREPCVLVAAFLAPAAVHRRGCPARALAARLAQHLRSSIGAVAAAAHSALAIER